jgi:hypothetical protein
LADHSGLAMAFASVSVIPIALLGLPGLPGEGQQGRGRGVKVGGKMRRALGITPFSRGVGFVEAAQQAIAVGPG